MRKKPPEGQQCENPDHLPESPHVGLQRFFWRNEREDRLCYAWWCSDCATGPDTEEIEGMEDWPRDEGGHFMTPVHCQIIPGLD